MKSKLNNIDYKKILNYYNFSIPKSKKLLKKKANKTLSTKLCRCIKKLDPVNEARSIGICTKTIFNNKGYTREKFGCKKKQFVEYRKIKTKKIKNKKN